MKRKRPFVLVCGLPGSGNRLLKRLLKKAGADAHVYHGIAGHDILYGALDKADDKQPLRAIIPVRHFHASCNSWPINERRADECMMITMQVLAERGIRTRLISYESLFLYPEQTCQQLLTWLRLPDTPWPDVPRDENHKWECH